MSHRSTLALCAIASSLSGVSLGLGTRISERRQYLDEFYNRDTTDQYPREFWEANAQRYVALAHARSEYGKDIAYVKRAERDLLGNRNWKAVRKSLKKQGRLPRMAKVPS